MIAKITIYLIATLLAVTVLGGGIYVYMNLGNISKMIAENVASEALGVKVSIGEIDVSVKDKIVTVSDIRLRNPRGYKKPNIMTVSNVTIKAGSLSPELLKFNDIRVSGTDVFVEVKNQTTNLHTLRDQVAVNSAKRDAEKTEAQRGKEPIKVIIQKFALQNTALHPSVTLLGDQDLADVKIDPIYLSGIGVRENGVLAQDAVAQITRQLMKAFNTHALESGFLSGMSVDGLRDMGLKQVGAIKEKAVKQITDEIDAVGDRLKSLF